MTCTSPGFEDVTLSEVRTHAHAAAIFINRPWVQSLALAIQIGGWIWPFAPTTDCAVSIASIVSGTRPVVRETR